MSRMSALRSKFFWKIYLTFSALILVSALLISWFVANKVETIAFNNLDHSSSNQITFLEVVAEDALNNKESIGILSQKLTVAARKNDTRINIIDKNGVVLVDTERNLETLENHATRPEIVAAVNQEYGKEFRFSSSMNEKLMYTAKAIRSNNEIIGFIRIAVPVTKANAEIQLIQTTLFSIAGAGIVFALLIGGFLTSRVTVPVSEMVQVAEALRRGEYNAKVKTITRDEIGRLGDTLNRLGSELTNKMADLHRLENVRRDFVANVSHEIKTPLTSIKGYIETLLSGADADPEVRHRFLEKIDRNANRLSALVQDILSLAKIEAAEASFKIHNIDLLPIITGILARYDDVAAAKNIRMNFKSYGHRLNILGDNEAVTQVIDNLLSNAIKYTPDGGRIGISVKQAAEWLNVEITDTGIGIPEEHQERIFERFYRVDKARSRDLGGTGLGLSIVKHLVNAMQGDIRVTSKTGVGSTFFVKLRSS